MFCLTLLGTNLLAEQKRTRHFIFKLNSFLVFISMFFVGFNLLLEGDIWRELIPLYFYIIFINSHWVAYISMMALRKLGKTHRSFAFIMTFHFCLDPEKLQWVRRSWKTIWWKLEKWEKKRRISSQVTTISSYHLFFSLCAVCHPAKQCNLWKKIKDLDWPFHYIYNHFSFGIID